MKPGSRLYRALDGHELEAVARDLFGAAALLESGTLLKGGLFNTTYLLCAGGEKAVVRVGPVNRQLLFDFEKDMMGAEPMLHGMLAGAGVPTSRVIKHVPAGRVIGREYLAVEHIPSVPMNDPALEGMDLAHINREVGRLVRRMHGITHGRFGWLRPQSDWGLHPTWAGFMRAFAAEAAARVRLHGLMADEQVDAFLRLFDENTALFDEITTPRLAHTDLWQGNMLLREDGAGGYALAAIIDVDRAVFGDADFDFVFPWMTDDAFEAGYGAPVRTAEGPRAARRALYRLLMGLFTMYVVLIEYDDFAWYDKTKAETLALLGELIQASGDACPGKPAIKER